MHAEHLEENAKPKKLFTIKTCSEVVNLSNHSEKSQHSINCNIIKTYYFYSQIILNTLVPELTE